MVGTTWFLTTEWMPSAPTATSAVTLLLPSGTVDKSKLDFVVRPDDADKPMIQPN